ncbi:MAG TPA: hypothetical protein VEH27_18745 [Methylomirabilota bacterium]|nr:hypothetical protein [Methylomirabilota bacterium]
MNTSARQRDALRRGQTLLRVIVALALIGCGLWLSCRGMPRLSGGISPAAPRALPELDQLLKTTATPESIPPLPQSTVTETERRVTVSITNKPIANAQLWGHTIHHLSPTGQVSVGETVVSLRAVGVVLPPNEHRTQGSREAQGRFFDRELKPLSEAAARELYPNDWDRRLDARGFAPSYTFRFTTEKGPGLKILSGEVRDARTGFRVTSGYSSGGGGGAFHFSPWLGAWHPAPVLVMIEVGYGDPEVVEIEAKPGATLEHRFGKLAVAAIVDGKSTSFSSNSRTTADKTQLWDYNFERDKSGRGCSVVFVCTPSTQSLPLDFEFLGEDGKRLDNHGTSSSASVLTAAVDAPASALKRVRILKRTQLGRIVMRLEELPGLPEDNRNVSDLMQVQAPVVHFDGEWEMRSFIELGTQSTLNIPRWVQAPPGYFPRTFTNATPAMIVEEMRVLQPTPTRVVYNSKKNEIQFRDPFWQELWRKIVR